MAAGKNKTLMMIFSQPIKNLIHTQMIIHQWLLFIKHLITDVLHCSVV